MAPVDSIQRLAVRIKLLRPAWFLIPSNSMGIEIGVIQLFPDTEKFDGIAVAQPVLNDVVRSLIVFVARNIGYADVVISLLRHYRDSSALYIQVELSVRQRPALHTSSWSCASNLKSSRDHSQQVR